MSTTRRPDSMDGAHARELRGDPITGDRYWSKDFMEKEWDHMWTRIWHIGAVVAELEQPGDYTVHNFRHESVILIKQEDGSIRAFYNTCQHRGNRLAWADGAGDGFTCSYHGWHFGIDGVLEHVQDPDDFEGGSPCGQVTLAEVRCEIWGPFAWYTMDDDAPPLLEYLDPMPALMDYRQIDKMVRVVNRTFAMDANWKFASDNFNESYHLPTVHPQLTANIDDDYKVTHFDMFPNGHNRMIELGQPSLRSSSPNEVVEPWGSMLRAWDLDPEDYKGRSRDGRKDLQEAMRRLGPERGYGNYFDALNDSELTDPHHHTMFPNVTLTAGGDGFSIFRTEPHITDPEKCTFDYWYFTLPVEGQESIETIVGTRPVEAAEYEFFDYGSGMDLPDMEGSFLIQDLSVAIGQQRGLHSRGYKDARLCGQESRIRRFHEVINDYLEGRR